MLLRLRRLTEAIWHGALCAGIILFVGGYYGAASNSDHVLLAASLPDQSRTYPDGTLIEDSSTTKVYLVYAGVRHLVSTAMTLAALGLTENSAEAISSPAIKALAEGPALSMRSVQGQPWPFATIISGQPSLFVQPPAASPGAVINVSGSHFGPSSVVQIRWAQNTGALDVQTDPSGNFSTSIVLSPNEGLETMLIYAFSPGTGAFAIQPFTLIPVAPASSVTGTPSVTMPGGIVRVSGAGFAPAETVSIFMGSGRAIALAIADANGTFRDALLSVPPATPRGSQWMVAYGTASRRTASFYLTVGTGLLTPDALPMASVVLTPTSGSVGSLVLASGQGFVAGDKIKIQLDSQPQVIVTADNAGGFASAGFTIPASTTAGIHTVTAWGTRRGRIAAAALAILPLTPRLNVTPASALPGMKLTLTGSGYAPRERVTLALNGVQVVTDPKEIVVDATGAFDVAVLVSSDALSGANSLTAIGSRSRASALATVSVRLPVASTWYFAGGTTVTGNLTQLDLVNTHTVSTTVDVTFMFAGGVPPLSSTVTVAPQSRWTGDVSTMAGIGHQVFIKLTADHTIGAGCMLLRPGRDFATTLGANSAQRTWYLAEGFTGLSFKETLHIFNPGPVTARVQVRLLPFNGLAGTTVSVVVQPTSGLSVPVNSYLPNQSLSAVVTADQPIVVARSQEFGPNSYGLTQHLGATRPSTTWLFAEGSTTNNFETYLTILNPDPRAVATVTASFFDTTGTSAGNKTISIAPLHRGNIRVNDVVHAGAIATVLTSDIAVVAERPIYFGAPNSVSVGGSDVFGRNGGGPRWLFPSGNTADGYTQFLLLQNPSSTTALVEATFYSVDGKVTKMQYRVPPESRVTINVNKGVSDLTPGPNSVALRSTNGVPFVAEESLYTAKFVQGDSTEGIPQ